MPVIGISDRLPAMITSVCRAITAVQPTARRPVKSVGWRAAMANPRNTSNKYAATTANAPAMPNSSTRAANTKSVCTAGM